MKFEKAWNFKKHILFTVIIALFAKLLPSLILFIKYKNIREAASIGIIGGADGPTSIFVSNKLWFFLLCDYLYIVLAGLLLLLYKPLKAFIDRNVRT